MKNIAVKSLYTLGVKGVQAPDDFDIKVGDKVILEDNNGLHLANVAAVGLKEHKDSDIKFVRKAEDADIVRAEKNNSKHDYASKLCNQYIEELALEMRLKKVYVNFDASKIIFYFTADNRVDFRELVKRLAVALALTRIEMRQISEREEVAMMGGVGACGRICCCTKCVGNCGRVSIKMAKNQNIALNPTKVNGYCGKLLCCLAYENDYYLETMKIMPKVGAEINLPDGTQGIVHYNNLVTKMVKVQLPNVFNARGEMQMCDYALTEIVDYNEDLKVAYQQYVLKHNDCESKCQDRIESAHEDSMESNIQDNTESNTQVNTESNIQDNTESNNQNNIEPTRLDNDKLEASDGGKTIQNVSRDSNYNDIKHTLQDNDTLLPFDRESVASNDFGSEQQDKRHTDD